MDSYECPVCYVVYDDPRCLPCGHSFCMKCISRIAGDRRNFTCPCCMENVVLNVAGAEGLPKNYSLSSIIQDLPSSMCSEHNKTFDMFCAECSVTICYKCIFGSHSGHNIEDIDAVSSEKKGIIANLLESTKLWQLKIKEKTDATEQSRRSMQEEAVIITSTIKDTFEKWHDALERQRHILLEHMDQETGKRIQVFDDYISTCESVITDINSLTTRMNKTLSEDKASVVQQFGLLKERYEKVRKKTIQTENITFISPDDLIIGIRAPWIEEAVENITLIDTRQTEESSHVRNIYSIMEENQVLKRDLERQKSSMKQLKRERKEYRIRIRVREKKQNKQQIDKWKECSRELKVKLEQREREKSQNKRQILQWITYSRQLQEKRQEEERRKDHLKGQIYELKQMVADILDEDANYSSRNTLSRGRSSISQLYQELEQAIKREQHRRRQLSELQEIVSKILEEDAK